MTESLLHLGIDELMPDPTQPRKTFIKEEIERLAKSIEARNILQPLRVQYDKERKCWLIVSGESRWRAARLAGRTTVPCVPVTGELSEADRLCDQITENSVRHDLLPLEMARALAKLKKLKGVNSQTLAEEMGLSNATLSRACALLTLPADIQQHVDDGLLPESSAYELTKLPDEESMREVANQIVVCRLNRDQVIEIVRLKVPKKNVQPKAGRVAGKLDGVSFSFSFQAGELTPETLLKAIEQIRSKLKELQKSNQPDVSALADLLKA